MYLLEFPTKNKAKTKLLKKNKKNLKNHLKTLAINL